MGRGVARKAGRPHRQQDAAILVGAPVEMTCEVHRGGTEMCQLGRGFCHRLWFFLREQMLAGAAAPLSDGALKSLICWLGAAE